MRSRKRLNRKRHHRCFEGQVVKAKRGSARLSILEESGTGGKKFSIIISNKYNSSYNNNNNGSSYTNNNNGSSYNNNNNGSSYNNNNNGSSYTNNNNVSIIIINNNNRFGDKMLVRRKRGERDLNEVSSSMKSRLTNPAYPSKKLKEEQTSKRESGHGSDVLQA